MKKKKNKNKETSNLGPQFITLVLQITLNICFWSGPIDFPSKMVPCKLNHNLICLCPGPLSKGLETNLKLLTNKNTQFHWTLLLGALYKVALKYKMPKLRISCTRFESKYTNCIQVEAMKIHVTAVKALRQNERGDEIQFTTKIDGKTSLGSSYFVFLQNLIPS